MDVNKLHEVLSWMLFDIRFFILWISFWILIAFLSTIRDAFKTRFNLRSSDFRYWIAISLRATWIRTFISYVMIAIATIVIVPNALAPPTLRSDLRATLVFASGIFFTVLYSAFRLRTKIFGITESTQDTIEESVEIYFRGLRTKKINEDRVNKLTVFVISRCGRFSPYLLALLDKNRGQKKYRGVGILLYTMLEDRKRKLKGLNEISVIHEIFGGLLRKFRLQDELLEDTGIRLFLMPPQVKKGQAIGTCPNNYPNFKPPDYKIVCCEEIAVMAKSIFYPAIDPVAIILDATERQTDWIFSYFESLFSPHCSWEFMEIAKELDGKNKVWEWASLAQWLRDNLGADISWFENSENAKLRKYCRDYQRHMTQHARREGIPLKGESAKNLIENQKKVLEKCINYLCSAGL